MKHEKKKEWQIKKETKEEGSNAGKKMYKVQQKVKS